MEITLKLKEEFFEEIKKVENNEDLENLRIKYMGKKGLVTDLMKEMKNLSNEEKKTFGQNVNILKNEVNDALNNKREEIKKKEIAV